MEAGEESAGDVEGGVAVGLVALDAGANATLFAYSEKLKPELRLGGTANITPPRKLIVKL